MARDVKINILGDATDFNRAAGSVGQQFAFIAAGAVAVGAALFKVGSEFDDAYDRIRVTTGATGDALEALKDDFRAVAATVPDGFGDIGQALADVNQRLGITGPHLQDLTRDLLDLSRITETDLTANIESVSRLFGDWGIATENQVDTLNLLFRASQATGPSVEHLSRLMVQFGAPMRQLGFTIEESVALLGQFEKQGVNTELVMGSMRKALGQMAREGEPAVETFNRVVESIKNAGSTSEANLLAIELFGARAGPDLAAAIREGKFEIDALAASIGGGSDTIQSATSDTDDWAEAWGTFVNQLKLAVEPAAVAFFGWLSEQLTWFTTTGWPEFTQRWQTFKEDFLLGAWIIRQEWNRFYEDFMRGAALVSSFIQPKWDALWAFFFDKFLPVVSDLAYKVGVVLVNGFETARLIGWGAFKVIESIVHNVRAAVEWLVDVVNDGVGAFTRLKNAMPSVNMPSLSMPGWWPSLPGFDSGGTVPGALGSPQVILAHGGETVLPTHKGGGRGMGGTTINLTVNALDPQSAAKAVVDAITVYERGNGAGWRAA